MFGIGQNIATIVGKNYEECKEIKEYWRNLYSTRSSAVHKGKSNKNNKVDIIKAYSYLVEIIEKFCLQKPYSDYDNFENIYSEIIEKKLYSFNSEEYTEKDNV